MLGNTSKRSALWGFPSWSRAQAVLGGEGVLGIEEGNAQAHRAWACPTVGNAQCVRMGEHGTPAAGQPPPVSCGFKAPTAK